MTYSQCPFEPVVSGRTAQDAILYRLTRHILRKNWRQYTVEVEEAVMDAVMTGTGFMRIGDMEGLEE